MYIGIEIGGTKVVMAMGTGPDGISPIVRFPTEAPDQTIALIAKHIEAFVAGPSHVDGIGIASFGPIQVNPNHKEFGTFCDTPKFLWRGFNIIRNLRERYPDLPIALDTDVNGAAVGEATWGAGMGLDSFAYVTVGTGIGAGLYINGQPVHGLLHPEAGHMLVRRDLVDDPFGGACPFHNDCLEGLASGPTIQQRTGVRGEDLADDHPVWPMVGRYLAQLYFNMTMITSPQRILVGGGVGLKTEVLESSHREFLRLVGGYFRDFRRLEDVQSFIRPAELLDRAGVLGAIALAARMNADVKNAGLHLRLQEPNLQGR